jgi:hypothetical protein
VKTIWPDTALRIFQRRFDLDSAYLADDRYAFVARRTRSITGIIYCPLSRSLFWRFRAARCSTILRRHRPRVHLLPWSLTRRASVVSINCFIDRATM